MIQYSKDGFLQRLTRISLSLAIFGVFAAVVGANTTIQAQKSRHRAANSFSESATSQQPAYTSYKGVRIGMTASEARTILGAPTQAAEDQDFWVVTVTETVQIFYDKTHKINAISIDYVGDNGGAPNYKDIVGANIDVKPDGSMYKMVRYDQLGFWVSYNRTASTVAIISITIQKAL